jgi:DNA invertase Pin-like site-specific DNA recombinase
MFPMYWPAQKTIFHGRPPPISNVEYIFEQRHRSLIDLLGTIQHLEACGVDLYLDQQAIDTTTPMGKLVFQLTGAFAEFERSLIRQRVHAGLKRAVAQGKRLGRPGAEPDKMAQARRELAKGIGIGRVARIVGLGTGIVHRLKRQMAAPE